MHVLLSNDLCIRKTTIHDFDFVFLLLRQLWAEKSLDRNSMEKVFQATLASERDFTFCALCEKRVVGFIAGMKMNNYYHAGEICYVSTLIVDERYRGKQIGKRLLDTVVDYAKNSGCNAVELDANFHRHDTHSFYERYGFHKRAFTFTLTFEEGFIYEKGITTD